MALFINMLYLHPIWDQHLSLMTDGNSDIIFRKIFFSFIICLMITGKNGIEYLKILKNFKN